MSLIIENNNRHEHNGNGNGITIDVIVSFELCERFFNGCAMLRSWSHSFFDNCTTTALVDRLNSNYLW